MAQKVDLQERLKMRFLTVDYRDKQEVYGTSDTASDTGTIALEILNIPDYVLEDLLKLTDPMMQLVDYLNHNKNPDNSTLAMMLTASRNVFQVVDLLRNVPPFAGQDFTWLDGKLPSIFSADAVKKAYRQRKKEKGEVFIPALCLVAQLGFGIRDFRQALIPLVESLDDDDVSRNPTGFAKQFDAFFSADKNKETYWMSITNVSVEYLPGSKGLVRRMHYASFPSMFRSNLYEALAAGNAPKRCPICKRFFLTTNARRQKYCTGYAPEEYGGLTCVQVGNRMGREAREKAENHPVIVLWHQTVNTIDKRVERGTLEKEIATKAKVRAKDLKDAALADNDYANGEYKNDMNPDTLIATVTKK
jgi:hypothetical protein